MTIDQLPESRSALLTFLKHHGTASMRELSETLGITYEATRQHVAILERAGWVVREQKPRPSKVVGRPTSTYRLTVSGDHLFPKHYDALSLEMVGAILDEFDLDGVQRILTNLTDKRVKAWAPVLAGRSLRDKLELLKGLYLSDDPWMEIRDDEGGYAVVERNCPFLNVAMARPALCSLTINTLRRLLGVQVAREQTFQNGDGRCVFRIKADQPATDADFVFEDLSGP